MTDPVNHPSHYGTGSIECLVYIEDFLSHEEYVGYLRGNIAKYMHRWRYKNGLEDLHKAQFYLRELIETREKFIGQPKPSTGRHEDSYDSSDDGDGASFKSKRREKP